MSSDFSTTSIAPLLPRKVLCTNNLDSSKNHSKADTNIEQKQKQQQQQQQPQNLMDREISIGDIKDVGAELCVPDLQTSARDITIACVSKTVLLLIIDSR